jgi:antitoxin YefM
MSAHKFRSQLRESDREQETLYVLQNKSLMEQIERSLKTHREGTGRRISPQDLDALDRV